jgi:prepilin-type N-terminal cleavage/methylation domain-containing protein
MRLNDPGDGSGQATRVPGACANRARSISDNGVVMSPQAMKHITTQPRGVRHGFTLVELLVVIAIIAVLISILLPSLRRAKDSAQAVQCQSNLRQWGIYYAMYTSDSKGKLPKGGDWNDSQLFGYWPRYMQRYFKDAFSGNMDGFSGNVNNPTRIKALFCPVAPEPKDSDWGVVERRGATFYAWKFNFSATAIPEVWSSSYGSNGWAVDPYQPDSEGWWMNLEVGKTAWRRSTQKGGNDIPLLGDAAWLGMYPQQNDPPPPARDALDSPGSQMGYFVLDRHHGAINMLFADFSVRRVPLKKLWALKWHKTYNVTGPFTIAGGVQPFTWPKWMRQFEN